MPDKEKIEFHFAVVLLYATGYDGVISDEELDNTISFLEGLFQGMEKEVNAADYLSEVIEFAKVLTPEKLFEETTQSALVLKNSLEKKYLIDTFNAIKEIMGDHTLSPSEENFLAALKNLWELS